MDRAVVWDLDGVIVDSAETHNASWAEMAREFNLQYDPERDFNRNFGKHNNDIIGSMWGITDPEEIDRMAMSKETNFRKNAAHLKPLPGVLDLMEKLKRAGWKQAIGSSAPSDNVKLLLSATGVAGYMDALATGDDVTAGKPDPEVFLIAFQRLGVAPSNGVVIEDAPAGIQAGVTAGAATLGVINTQTEESLKEAGATLVVGSLAKVNVDDLERLIAEHAAASGH